MPDIAMCKNESCPLRLQCYRYRAKPSEYRQSYFAGSPRTDDGCEFYWSIEGYDEQHLTPVERKETDDENINR